MGNTMKLFACSRSYGKGLVVCVARSKEEAFGVAVAADNTNMYNYNVEDFYELEGVECRAETPRMLAEGGGE